MKEDMGMRRDRRRTWGRGSRRRWRTGAGGAADSSLHCMSTLSSAKIADEELSRNRVKSFRFTSDVVGGSGGRGPWRILGRGTLRLRGTGFVVVIVRLFCTVIQHEDLGLMGDSDGAGTLGPRLPVHLHGHLGTLENQLKRDK